MRILFADLSQKLAESASDFACVVRNLIRDVHDCYRPGLYDMRGTRPENGATSRETEAHVKAIKAVIGAAVFLAVFAVTGMCGWIPSPQAATREPKR